MTVVINLQKKLGTHGFTIRGDEVSENLGRAVSSGGDFNGDGFDDVLVGAAFGDDKALNSGQAYLIFGRAGGYLGVLDEGSLTPDIGIIIQGAHREDFAGYAIAGGGDINGDGLDDLIVDAPGADDGGKNSGNTYVIFGRADAPGLIDLANFTPADGFVIQGPALDIDAPRRHSFSTGDVNGDGFDDIVFGNYLDHSKTYVIFGKADGFGPIDVDSLSPSDGFAIVGAKAGDWAGFSVSSGGDINGDGFDDMIIGASRSSNGSQYANGAAYVVYGKASGVGTIDLGDLSPTDGFLIQGALGQDHLGWSVASAGDINADGFADVIVGAPLKGQYNGEAYVIFGKAETHGPIYLSDFSPEDGFSILGSNNRAGWSVASAGDVNGDGFADILVGATLDSKGGQFAGAAYVLYGKADGFGDINLAHLADDAGFKIQGDSAVDYAGTSVSSAGDVNGDGFDDVLVGAWGNDGYNDGAGAAYVIYGMAPTEAVTRVGTAVANTIHGGAFDDTLDGVGGDDTLIANAGNDIVLGRAGKDDLTGGDGDDTLNGGTGDDIMHGGDGADRLIGGGGRDTLYGGPGKDVLTGSAAADSFHFSLGGTAADGANADKITDFSRSQHDVIDLSDYDADPSTRPDDPFTFIGAAAFSGAVGELRAVFAGSDTLVSGDTNGDKVADFTIRLTGNITLTAADFLFAAAAPPGGAHPWLAPLDLHQDPRVSLV